MQPNNGIQQIFLTHKKKLKELSHFLSQLPLDNQQSNWLKKIDENLEQEKFRLVVLGQFKRGKSTFINALLGEDILPTDVIPLTAVITEISYGDRVLAEVFLQNGTSQIITPQQLGVFVSEAQNPKNRRAVDKVILRHPADILKKGIILVDTPGVGSIHQHNSRLTQEYIPNVDAAIFLFSADPPLTELEQEFLKIIQPIVPKTFFVLNKKDYLEAQSLQRVIEFNRDILAEIIGEKPPIQPISALQALRAKENHSEEAYVQSGLSAIEKELQRFLMTHRGKLVILSNAERLERICLERQNFIEMERKAQALTVEKLQTNLAKFKEYMAKMKRHDQRLSSLLDGLRSRLVEQFDHKVKDFVNQTQPQVLEKLDAFIAKNKKRSNGELQKQGENLANNAIVDAFEPFRMGIEKNIKKQYSEEIEFINQEVIDIINNIYRYSNELFEMEYAAALPKEIWHYKSQFYYRTWEVVTTMDYLEKGLVNLLPKPIFLSFYRKKMAKLIKEKLERQCGRLRADFLYRLRDSNRQYLFEFNETIQKIQNNIAGMMQKYVQIKQKGEADFSQLVKEQQKTEVVLNSILDELSLIKGQWNFADTLKR